MKYRDVYLIDLPKDLALPWSPTANLETILSNQNFFYVFYPEIAGRVNYLWNLKIPDKAGSVIIDSDEILTY